MRRAFALLRTTCLALLTTGAILAPAPAAPVNLSDGVKWVSLDSASDWARRQDKKILIDVYTDWCGWCKVMHQKTYSDPEVVEYMRQKYLAVRLNAWEKKDIWFKGNEFKYMPDRKAHQLAYQLLDGKMKFPTTVILNKNSEVLSPVQGFMEPKVMLKVLRYFGEDHHLKMSWEEYSRQYR